MKLQSKDSIRPFSLHHEVKVVLPGTNLLLTVSSHEIRGDHFLVPTGEDPFTRPFMVELDLERSCIWVQIKKKRLKIRAKESQIHISYIRPEKKEFCIAFPSSSSFPKEVERLSLGSFKKQNWDLLVKAQNQRGILPILYLLSQKSVSNKKGVLNPGWKEDFYRHFESIGTFRNEGSYAALFQEIRALFFEEKEGSFFFLFKNSFASGKLSNIQTSFGSLSFEWAKGRVKRLEFQPKQDCFIPFRFPSVIRSFRCRLDGKAWLQNGKEPLEFKANQSYFFDRFME